DLITWEIGFAQQLRIRLVADPAFRTKKTDQTLAEDRADRVGDHKGLDAKVYQSAKSGDRVVGVQRGKHHVAGLGGLTGNFRGFLIANLTNVNHIRVLPQDATQLTGKRLARLRIDLDLGYVLDSVFHRVLNGNHVLLKA